MWKMKDSKVSEICNISIGRFNNILCVRRKQVCVIDSQQILVIRSNTSGNISTVCINIMSLCWRHDVWQNFRNLQHIEWTFKWPNILLGVNMFPLLTFLWCQYQYYLQIYSLESLWKISYLRILNDQKM